MTARAVEAVFFWRYSKAAFAAVYGRFPGSTQYSKDFLQSPSNQYPIIDEILDRGGASSVPVQYRWPGGQGHGEWRMSAADARGQLSWLPMNASPAPWKVGDPQSNPAITIPGNPSRSNETGANEEYKSLESTDIRPWIVAVKLADETGVLYPRAYLTNPPAGLEARSLATLPAALRSAISKLNVGVGGGAVTFTSRQPVSRAPALMRRILDSLAKDPNVLLIGPPGTGKSVVLEDLQEQFLAEAQSVYFDPDKWTENWSEGGADSRRAISIVFHPSYGYEDFVAGLMPSMESTGFRLTARPGPLLSLSHWASGSKSRRALLSIDEFNRGATSAIFGDTIALLDRDKRSDTSRDVRGATILRPYPREKMQVDPSFANEAGSVDVGASLSLPASLLIVAALNSSDRSVAPLDAALRRRFAIISVDPDYEVLAGHLGIPCPKSDEVFSPSNPEPADWSASEIKALAINVLRTLNDRIGSVLGPDFLLGHALLWAVLSDSPEELATALAHAFDERIFAALRLAFVDQDETLAGILRIGMPEAVAGDSAAVGQWLLPSEELESVATPRLKLLPLVGRSRREVLSALRDLL